MLPRVNLAGLSVLWLTAIWFFDGIYLSHRNRNVVKRTTEAPKELAGQLSQYHLDTARTYSLDRSA